ncbi:hypothetical protein BBD42_28520 [Paenibacillus sp. BIHB 4019]|uniref:Methyltransferase domain-containing protein n=1 Tax=Paenibacillus sp. BIHB 4019 TaxID=1870819 RepID=A0A1B2DQL9_9BACL|nr:methyltransferase domain-containing protein [Paenibacillus sp. BIHB 4019]ANY70006.1 hypothetical protein BBD42_28520 [Paenibacillus sp. BIHB 4019]
MKEWYSEAGLTPAAYWTLAWEQAAQSDSRVGNDAEEESYWQQHAPVYDERNPLAPYTAELMGTVIASLRSGDELLEVGPGTGGFTQLLAPYVGKLTVVEPSAAMYEILARSWEQSGLAQAVPEAIHAKWEESSGLACDVLFSANAFYRIRDMKESLAQMNLTARRRVYLVQSIGLPFAHPLRVMYGGKQLERSRAQVLCDILQEMEIAHQMDTFAVQRKSGAIHDVALISWDT